MKNSKRFKQLKNRLLQVSGSLDEAIEAASSSNEVVICNVSITKSEALQMQKKINQIMHDDTLPDLIETFIPIQLLMVDDTWRKIQADINELKK